MHTFFYHLHWNFTLRYSWCWTNNGRMEYILKEVCYIKSGKKLFETRWNAHKMNCSALRVNKKLLKVSIKLNERHVDELLWNLFMSHACAWAMVYGVWNLWRSRSQLCMNKKLLFTPSCFMHWMKLWPQNLSLPQTVCRFFDMYWSFNTFLFHSVCTC